MLFAAQVLWPYSLIISGGMEGDKESFDPDRFS